MTSASTATHPPGPQITGFASRGSRGPPGACAGHDSTTRALDPGGPHLRDGDLRPEVPLEVLVGLLERGRVVDPEPHTTDVGLVLDTRRGGLQRDREPEPFGGPDRVLERGGP